MRARKTQPETLRLPQNRSEHLPNNTVCALAQLLGHMVSVAHDEVLAKDLVDLAIL